MLIFVLWFVFIRSGKHDESYATSNWLKRIEEPARHAEEIIVDFVASRTSSESELDWKYNHVDKINVESLMAAATAHQSPTAATDQSALLAPSDLPPIPDVQIIPHDQKTPEPPGVAFAHRVRLPDPVPTRATSWSRYLTVATMIKNKRRWLREWIEFYRMMGVEHFILYDNGSTDEPLEILQCYIDEGIMDFIPWPPKEVPPPIEATTKFEHWQDAWFRDSLDTCLNNDWTMHRQGPCQLAAFTDALRRTKGGVSRWLGIWDVDEFIFPRQHCKYDTIIDLLKGEYADTTHIRIFGNVFGTSGHITPARRKPGSPLQALMTEEYTLRAELDRIPAIPKANLDHNAYPFAKVQADGVEVHGRGKLASVKFGGGDMYARKALADPDMVSHSWIHHFEAPGNVVVSHIDSADIQGPGWKEARISADSTFWKFNHYAFLSQADARRKAIDNKNPFMNFDSEIDEFFSREIDTEVHYLVPQLKERMIKAIQEHPPAHPDDWEPLR